MSSLQAAKDNILKQEDAQTTGKARHMANTGLPAGTLYTQTKSITGGITHFHFDPPIKAATFEVRPTASATPDADEAVLLAIGAPNLGVATDWLNEAITAPRETIKLEDGIQGRYFAGGLIEDIWVKGVGTTPLLDLTVGGIK